MGKYIVWLFVLLLFPYFILAECNPYNTPNILTKDYFNLWDNLDFYLDINSAQINRNSSFSYAHMNSSLSTFNMNSEGVISFVPKEIGTHKIMILAYTKDDCYDSKIVTFNVNERPNLSINPVNRSLEMDEGKGLLFSVSANKNISYEWYLDDKLMSNKTKFGYFPSYNASGDHVIKLVTFWIKNYREEFYWDIFVFNVNRKPVLLKKFPKVSIATKLNSNMFNLHDYFMDPDNDSLTFSFVDIPAKSGAFLDTAKVSILFIDGFARANTFTDTGYKFVKFIANDSFGKSVESNKVEINVYWSVLTLKRILCGDDICSNEEACSTCPADCGVCDAACTPSWVCEDWGFCQLIEIQIRHCIDINNCDLNIDRPEEVQTCEYIPNCGDEIQNQDEEGIDCGGVCDACPTCFDNV